MASTHATHQDGASAGIQTAGRSGLKIYLFESQGTPQRRNLEAMGEGTKVKDKILKTEKVDWRKLKPFQPKELKKTTPERLAKLKRSLENNGFAAPFYVWQRGKDIMSLDGHHRLMVLPELIAEGKKVPEKLTCCFLDLKNEKEARTVFLAYQSHYAQMTIAGFEDFTIDLDIDDISKSFEPFTLKWGFKNASQNPAESKPLPVVNNAIAKRGDIFCMKSPTGIEHRLICADSTISENWDYLDIKANCMVFTSPPYGLGENASIKKKYNKKDKEKKKLYIEHSDDPIVWLNMIDRVSKIALAKSDVVFVNLQMLAANKQFFLQWLNSISSNIVDIAIWDKGVGAPQMQKNIFSNSFEFIVIISPKKNANRCIPLASFHGSESNIVRVNRGKNNFSDVHGAVMPIDLAIWAINICKKSEVVIDPFAGTGTTLIACENLNKSSHSIEIDPHYCDVILKRWINHVPKGKITRNGKEFSI